MLQCAIRPEDGRAIPINGWYAGTDAIQKGDLFVLDLDYGTAADADASRVNRVVRPAATGSQLLRCVAGVAARNYSANASGQKIELLAPGSVCEINVLKAPTILDRVTAIASAATGVAGKWGKAGYPGRGSATVLRTRAAIAADTDLSEGWFAASEDGTATYTASTKTITKTSAFANVPDDVTSSDGVYVYILAGTTVATGVNQITPGKYLVASKTSDNAIILVDSAGANDTNVIFYCVRGNPTVLALLDGPTEGNLTDESGLVQYASVDSGGEQTPALMPGGWTYLCAPTTDLSVAGTSTIVDGSFQEQRKGFSLLSTIAGTTADWTLTATSSNIIWMAEKLPVTSTDGADFLPYALASVALDAAADFVTLVWRGSKWIITGAVAGAVGGD